MTSSDVNNSPTNVGLNANEWNEWVKWRTSQKRQLKVRDPRLVLKIKLRELRFYYLSKLMMSVEYN